MKRIASWIASIALIGAMSFGVPLTAMAEGSADSGDVATAATAASSADPFEGAAITSLEDGQYTMNVALAGGSGKATVSSPAAITVQGGKASAEIEWSSSNYDYMVVNGNTYLPVNTDGNSVFQIPITAYDEPISVVADTTAMGTPHAIDYTLTFDSASAAPASGSFPVAAVVIVVIVVVVVVVVALVVRNRKKNAGPSAESNGQNASGEGK